MACFSRKDIREKLEAEISGEGYKELLEELREGDSIHPGFSNWGDLISFMHRENCEADAKDSILLSIFKAHKRSLDARWRTVLMVIFWPALESIHWQKRRWDSDPDERWQNIVWTFLKVVCKIDPEIRRCRLASKVFNDTVHHLWDEYRRAWKRAEWEISMEEESIEDLATRKDQINHASIELAVVQKVYIEKLRKHLGTGTIDESDYLLVVGTRIYGKMLADYAREKGIGYQAAKKRRQRAEALIRKAEGKPKGYNLFSPQESDDEAF